MFARPTILAYHAVGEVPPGSDPLQLFLSPDVFTVQMEFLARHRRVVPLDQTIEARFATGRPAVAITFDDGYRCLLDHAIPVLEEHGFPATLFVPTAMIGDRNRWDPPTNGLEIMSAEELRDVAARGVAIESHGHRHIDLTSVPSESAGDDLKRSVAVLTELLDHPPQFLAYPWGRETARAQDSAEQFGFRAAFTIGTRDRGRYARARVPVRSADRAWQFRVQTSGHWPALRFSRVGHPLRVAARAGKARRGRRVRPQ